MLEMGNWAPTTFAHCTFSIKKKKNRLGSEGRYVTEWRAHVSQCSAPLKKRGKTTLEFFFSFPFTQKDSPCGFIARLTSVGELLAQQPPPPPRRDCWWRGPPAGGHFQGGALSRCKFNCLGFKKEHEREVSTVSGGGRRKTCSHSTRLPILSIVRQGVISVAIISARRATRWSAGMAWAVLS